MRPRLEGFVALATERHPWAALGLVTGLLYLPWLGAEPVTTTLEGLRLVPAREMLETGDWVVPRLAGDPYLAKPPLVYWAIALVSWPLGGVSAWSGRLVSVLCVAATMALVLAWGRRHLGPRPGFLAALGAGATALAFEKGSRAELEALLLLASTAALVALFEAWRRERGRARAVALAGVALGAAVLTKGPVPLLATGAAVAALATFAGRRGRTLASAAGALVVAGCVCLPWLLALAGRFEGDELRRVIEVELLSRVEEADAINEEPPLYYVEALLRGLAPFSLLVPGLWALRRGTSRLPAAEERGLLAFLLGWSVGTLVLLSLSSGKEARYLLPTYPAWAMLLAWGWCQRARWPALVRYGRGLLAAAALVGLALPLVLPWVVARGAPALWAPALALCALLGLGTALAVAGGWRGRPAWLAAGLAAALVAARGLWGEVYWPQRAPGYPYAEVAAAVDAHVGPGEPLLGIGRIHAPLLFYLDRPVHRLHDADDLAACQADPACRAPWLLTDAALPGLPPPLATVPTKRTAYRLHPLP